MPVKHIIDRIPWSEWQKRDPRYMTLDVLDRFLHGAIYNHLPYPFYQETKDGTGDYIPLRDRRPSVIYNLPRVIVERSTSLVFGDKHWPKLYTSEQSATEFLQNIVDTTSLQATMLEAAFWGSIGSVAIMFSIINDQFHYEIWNTKYCSPLFDNTRELKQILLRYPTYGYDLRAIGFTIDDDNLGKLHFFIKKVDTKTTTIYSPILCEEWDPDDPQLNISEEVAHNYGFIPGVWIRNFPISSGIDAEATFSQILHISVEIDYQLSQCGRGLKYNSDPQLMIKEPPAPPDNQLGLFGPAAGLMRVRSTSNALIVGSEGDAKLLEISGQGQKAVLEFVKEVRKYALEVARGSRKDPDKAYGNTSGRAMEILDEDPIALAAVLRISYGERGLKPLVMKILRAAKQAGLYAGEPDALDFSIKLQWGNWFDPTPTDHFQEEQALDLAVRGRRLYESEARMLAAARWAVGYAKPEDVDAEYPIPPTPNIVKDEIDAGVAIKRAAPARTPAITNGNG